MKYVLLCFSLFALTCISALAQQYKVLHSFSGPPDGELPYANLVGDKAGNLYGTTVSGGTSISSNCGSNPGCGTVFELSPRSGGGWKEAVLYSFCTKISNNYCLDGFAPYDGLVMDAAGNLYGTTEDGGVCTLTILGCGTVFELSPPKIPGAAWTESVIYSFCSNNSTCPDGLVPGSIIFDAAGNLYGTAIGGGSANAGVVFELSPGSNGWTEKVLYNFCSQAKSCPDGSEPFAGVVFDEKGNLYGTTYLGGDNPYGAGGGVIYELSPGAHSSSEHGWTETVLYAFDYYYVTGSVSPVSLDASGNLYGTTTNPFGSGAIYKLSPNGEFRYYVFNSNGNFGLIPEAGLLLDSKADAAYGTTTGAYINGGKVFIFPAQGSIRTLYSFCSKPNCIDGAFPTASVIQDNSGNLYGTTQLGGDHGLGVAYELTP